VLIGIATALLLTLLLLIAALAIRRPTGKKLQLEAAYRRFSPSGDLPSRNRRWRLTLLIFAVLVILNVIWLGLLLYRAPGEGAVEPTSAQSAPPGGPSSSVGTSPTSDSRLTPGAGANTGRAEAIQLEDVADSAKPFETVQIQGRYHGGANTFLRVQREEGGKWLDFPLSTKTDQSGQFTAYVEFPQPGSYRVRVLDPDSGVTSKPLVLVVKG
jgi:hypothetical protein